MNQSRLEEMVRQLIDNEKTLQKLKKEWREWLAQNGLEVSPNSPVPEHIKSTLLNIKRYGKVTGKTLNALYMEDGKSIIITKEGKIIRRKLKKAKYAGEYYYQDKGTKVCEVMFVKFADIPIYHQIG